MTSIRCAIVLLRVSDANSSEVQPRAFFDELFLSGPQSLSQYWSDVSFGNVDFTGSQVFDWHTIWQSDWQFLDELSRNSSYTDRPRFLLNTAEQNSGFQSVINSTPFHQIPFDLVFIVIKGNSLRDYGNGRSEFSNDLWSYASPETTGSRSISLLPINPYSIRDTGGLNYLARQVGYYLRLPNSADNSEREYSTSAEVPGLFYDAYDLMSASTEVYRFGHPRFGYAGPNLCASQSNARGWLPNRGIHYIDADHSAPTDICLTSLSWNNTVGRHQPPGTSVPLLMINIAYQFTIELRTREGWDAGIPVDQTIIIHQIIPHPTAPHPYTTIILMRSPSSGSTGTIPHEWAVRQQWDSRTARNFTFPLPAPELAGYTLITVLSYDLANHSACVHIEHHPAPQWPIYIKPEELYRYKGCLLILDGQLNQFAAKQEATKIIRQLVAIEQASRLGDTSSIQFQIAQLDQIGQEVHDRSQALQKQLQAGNTLAATPD